MGEAFARGIGGGITIIIRIIFYLGTTLTVSIYRSYKELKK